MEELLEQLRKHFSSMTHEEIEKEWKEYDKYNNIGPTVNEFLEQYE
jgi:recombinational DNA repair protein RecT